MNLQRIKELLPDARVVINGRNPEITSVAYDSRQVKAGSLFVAIKGEKADGHRFIAEAVNRGAVSLLTSRKLETAPNIPQIIVSDTRRALAIISHHFYNLPATKIKIIGITGTNGKTTTAYLVRSILESAGYKTGQLGTISYYIGKREIPAPMTTPESAYLAGYLAEMVAGGLDYAVMEVSSHALIQRRTHLINFTTGLFTNLGRDHLDFHKNLKEYRKAKGILFRQLSEKATAVLNADDPAGKYLGEITKAKIIKYGLDRPADFTVRIKTETLDDLSLIIRTPNGEIPITSSLVGRHNAYNIISAIATAWSVGVTDPAIISKGVQSLKSVRGRLEKVETKHPFKVMIDFAHTPNALEQVLASLRPLVKRHLMVVFGCGGDRDKGKRPLMGRVVERYADVMILTSDNPRSEEPWSIIKDIEKGLSQKSQYEIQPDRRTAIAKAISLAKSGDLILIAGKGHETCQIFKDTVKPFDDRVVAEEILSRKKSRGSKPTTLSSSPPDQSVQAGRLRLLL